MDNAEFRQRARKRIKEVKKKARPGKLAYNLTISMLLYKTK